MNLRIRLSARRCPQSIIWALALRHLVWKLKLERWRLLLFCCTNVCRTQKLCNISQIFPITVCNTTLCKYTHWHEDYWCMIKLPIITDEIEKQVVHQQTIFMSVSIITWNKADVHGTRKWRINTQDYNSYTFYQITGSWNSPKNVMFLNLISINIKIFRNPSRVLN